MKEWLTFVSESAVVIINAMALAFILVGTIEAFFRGIRALFYPQAIDHLLRKGYMQYGRWLVAGLTFQLAADIIETTIAPTWYEIGRVGAIAAIRTFLNFFLERDLAEIAHREAESLNEDAKPL